VPGVVLAVLAAVLLFPPIPASAGGAPSQPAGATADATAPTSTSKDVGVLAVFPGSHRCTNFGGTHSGYRAGHCGDVDLISSGMRGQGQSFCQRSSGGGIVQCAGLRQTVTIRNITTNVSRSAVFVCGRFTNPWHNPPCPAGRFQNLTGTIPFACNQTYVTIVSTVAVLPVSAVLVSNSNFESNRIIVAC
jgi:hypothetical protein